MIKNKDKIVSNLVNSFLIFAILFIEGCFNFVELEFDFNRIATTVFWGKLTIRLTLLLLVKYLAIRIFIPIIRDKLKELKFHIAINIKLLKLKAEDFPYYIYKVRNPEIKIEAWKEYVSRKLAKLERKAKQSSRELWASDSSISIKKTNKYCRLHFKYDEWLTQSWIEKNIQTLPITKYDKLDAAVFDVPVIAGDIQNKYKVTANNAAAIAISLSSSSILLVLSQMFLNLFEYGNSNVSVLSVILTLAMDLLFIGWQFLMGINDANRIVNQEELFTYINRNRILKEYLYWKEPDRKDSLTILLDELEKSSLKAQEDVSESTE